MNETGFQTQKQVFTAENLNPSSAASLHLGSSPSRETQTLLSLANSSSSSGGAQRFFQSSWET